jgi:nicotinamide-nucleotide amidase
VRVAVVAVGDELLLGHVVNQNLAWIGRTLAAAGVPLVRGVEVPDDVDAIRSVLLQALSAADAVVLTGGLGPTSDDVTRAALAAAAGVPLRRDRELAAALADWYADRGLRMPPGVLVQADVPDGARPLPNPVGTAAGLRLQMADQVVYALPGVPAELRQMVETSVVPELVAAAGGPAPVLTTQLRVAVMGESLVAEHLSALEPDLPDGVHLSYLASPGEVLVRLTGRDPRVLAGLRERAAAVLGEAVSGLDEETLPATVLRLLSGRGETVAAAESLTGGALAAALVDVPGASSAFVGAVVAYSSELKERLLDVPPALLAGGAVHPDVAGAMAAGVRRRAGSTWGVATTGVAGPDHQDGQPPGTVFVAVAGPRADQPTVRALTLRGDRAVVRSLSVTHALDLLRRSLGAVARIPEQRT